VIFNSFVFIFAFLPITYLVFWSLKQAQWRYVWLTFSGYVFYGYWDPRFCLLMAFSTIVSYTAGRMFLSSPSPAARKWILVVPVTIDLLLLGFFKYAGFAMRTLQEVLDTLGWHAHLPVLDIVLPIGISFYTFHTISYIVDSYRGVITPTRKFFEFSSYVSLFSQLVAGPIVRFRQIEKDLDNVGHVDRRQWLLLGVSYFTWGLLEKVLVADSLAHYVDAGFTHAGDLTTVSAWLVMLGYTFQLYFDFCGYSDMAIGLGYLFGLRIPLNFNSPYRALNPSDFWRRWHISLSSCLRDYLYISMGGNRGSTFGTYRNLFLTMLIGGLWHGANWTFVLWGAYHGVLLIAYRLFGTQWDRLPKAAAGTLTFLLVVLGWVLFRAPTIGAAAHIYAAMFNFIPGIDIADAAQLAILVVAAGAWSVWGPNAQEAHQNFKPTYFWSVAATAVFTSCLTVMAGGRSSPFLYFQF
jgi:alginate O-acetyltransferase complex protein AlgI